MLRRARGEETFMSVKRFTLAARVSTESPEPVRRALRELLPGGSITRAGDDFQIEGTMRGESARDLNRALLSALRRIEKRTRLRAEWTSGGTTARFFDYVPKGAKPSPP
jgi:predicted RNA binding protein with dsRBD fold (UPF0201 family)